jgi:TonB family protein
MSEILGSKSARPYSGAFRRGRTATRSCLPIAMLLPICACASMGPVTPSLPITPHAVSEADYPQDSVKSQEQGATTLRYVILEDGTTGDIPILKSSGFARLDQASIEMVKSKWRFKPATTSRSEPRGTRKLFLHSLSPTPTSYLLVYTAPESREPEIALTPEAQMLIAPSIRSMTKSNAGKPHCRRGRTTRSVWFAW